MDDAVFMSVGQTGEDGGDDLGRPFRGRKAFGVDFVPQRVPIEILHRDVVAVGLLAHLKHGHDVWVLEGNRLRGPLGESD